MRVALAFAVVGWWLASGLSAGAAEQGCERLAWDLGLERTLLAEATTTQAGVPAPPLARRLALRPIGEAGLPMPPGREPRSADARAGHLSATIAAAGLYRVTLSEEGWIDVVQGGAYLQPDGFTGVRGCPGIRKSVRFRLQPGPVTVQVSGSSADAVAVSVTPDR
jgi:hypothetical protein